MGRKLSDLHEPQAGRTLNGPWSPDSGTYWLWYLLGARHFTSRSPSLLKRDLRPPTSEPFEGFLGCKFLALPFR